MKGSHNATLVAFSILIAILASYTALALSARVNAARGRFRVAWLAGGGVALGIGIWSMHFVGLLAYRLPVPISYAVPLWLLSLTIAVGASLLALWVTSRAAVPVSARVAAGVLLGVAVAGMHYAGMGAMRIPGRIAYDPALVVLSIGVAVAAGFGIIWLFMRLREEQTARGQLERIAAAVAMGGALAAIHYAGMAAARFTPLADGALTVPGDSVLRTDGLAAVVIVGTLAVLAMTLLTTRVDRRLRARDEETEAVRRSESRFRSLVDASAQVVWTAGADGTFVEPQGSWAAYTGTSWEEYGSGGWIAAVHPDDRARVAAEWRDAVAARRVTEVEFRLRRADGDWRHVAVRAVPVMEPGGRVREWVGAVTDVTERRQAEAARDFLAEASRVLASSLDTETTLRTVARLAVPTLADWCAVDLLTEDGQVQRLAVEHVDPDKVRLALEIEERWPSDRSAPQGVHQVMRTGEAEMMGDIPESLLTAGARDPEHLRMIHALGLRSYVCVPLVVRRRVLGALTLVHAESGRSYTPADLALAEELARRAAVAIDNARLYTETEESRIQLEQQTAELEEAQAEMEMAHDELQRANDDLAERTMESERAREAADEANAAKSAFLATMSHELRTPLNAIAGYTQLMSMGIHGPVSDAQREALDKIHRNQTHLLGLINDVLNFAKIEAGQVQYDVEDVPLNATLSAVEALVEPQLRAKHLRYRYGGGDPYVTVRADRERMEQVVLNLLSNAVKFTDRGGQVELSWEAGDGAVRIHVRDTGRGIPPDKLEAIFEPFVQVDPALTRSAEGTGLGLAISRDLARAMKGDLTALSAEGEGSVFTLTLPIGRPVPAAALQNAAD